MVKGTAELERPVPLYMQVVRQLRAQIAAGELAEGERIPSQRQMMQHWRISMQTASKVIGALKTEGLAIASAGRDTIVAPGAATRIAAAAAGVIHAAAEPPEDDGLEVTATAATTAAPAEVAEVLGIPAGRRALRRAETRYSNGKPVSVRATWFPPAIAAKAPRLANPLHIPSGVMAYIAEATGDRAMRVIEENGALPADEDAAESLGISTGTPVLVSRAWHYTSTGQIIGYAETSTAAGRWQSRTYTLAGS